MSGWSSGPRRSCFGAPPIGFLEQLARCLLVNHVEGGARRRVRFVVPSPSSSTQRSVRSNLERSGRRCRRLGCPAGASNHFLTTRHGPLRHEPRLSGVPLVARDPALGLAARRKASPSSVMITTTSAAITSAEPRSRRFTCRVCFLASSPPPAASGSRPYGVISSFCHGVAAGLPQIRDLLETESPFQCVLSLASDPVGQGGVVPDRGRAAEHEAHARFNARPQIRGVVNITVAV